MPLEVVWKTSMKISRSVHNNIARVSKRTRRTISTSPNGILVWWKDTIDGLINKGDSHVVALGVDGKRFCETR